MQGRDHPVLLGVPETYYLKCFILRAADLRWRRSRDGFPRIGTEHVYAAES